eukprot:5676966-Amphidinium_carterae.1
MDGKPFFLPFLSHLERSLHAVFTHGGVSSRTEQGTEESAHVPSDDDSTPQSEVALSRTAHGSEESTPVPSDDTTCTLEVAQGPVAQ